MTYSLTAVPGRPNMLTVDSDAVELVMSQSFDITQRGVYSGVVLTADLAFSDLSAEKTFNVQINPCKITDFTVSPADLGTV